MKRLGVAAALVEGELVKGDVGVEDGLVAAVGLPPGSAGLAVPGLVDLQVNGYAGVDLLTADADGWAAAALAMARTGVTAFVANLITSPLAATARAVGVAAAAAGADTSGRARCLGAHLEGPFLSELRRGTHPAEHLRAPDLAELDSLLAAGPVVAVTVAPELPGALEVIDALAARGVLVSLGHSDADAEQAHAGFDAGARTVTHVLNGMRQPTSREPALAGVALARDDVTVQLICDGVHVSPEMSTVVISAARSRFVLVTDSIAAAGAPDRGHRVGDVEVTVVAGQARNAEGALAGGLQTLAAALRCAVAAGASVEDAVAAASTRPAELLGRDDLGRLRPGDPAQVTVLDDSLAVTATHVAGELVD